MLKGFKGAKMWSKETRQKQEILVSRQQWGGVSKDEILNHSTVQSVQTNN